MKKIIVILVSLLAAIILGALLMILAYAVPISRIEEHIVESCDVLENEPEGYAFAPRVSTSYPDYVTDALMLCEAVAPREGALIEDAMKARQVRLESHGSAESLILMYRDGIMEGRYTLEYPRYWHGYLIWLKPLLSVMAYSEIRILAMWFQLTLLVTVMYLLIRQDRCLAFAFFVSFLFLNPITAAMSIQYASVYCITLVMTICLLAFDTYLSERVWLVFLWGGIATAFFDFFTYPMAALGIPLIVYTAVTLKNGIKQNIMNIGKYSACFFVGYGGMWSGKWIVAELLTEHGVIKDAISQVLYRMNDDENATAMTVPYVFKQIFMHLNNRPMKLFAVLFVLTILLLVISRRYRFSLQGGIVPILIVALYPFIWYILVRNHSATHARIEQRELAITIMALVFSILLCLKKPKPSICGKV